MDNKLLEQLKVQLEKEKAQIEKTLGTFAKKDSDVEGDWETRFPNWNEGGSSGNMEIAADEVEEYTTLLSLEHVLEIRLENVNLALKKIFVSLGKTTSAKLGQFGFCEKCNKEINTERLKVFPEARTCIKCK